MLDQTLLLEMAKSNSGTLNAFWGKANKKKKNNNEENVIDLRWNGETVKGETVKGETVKRWKGEMRKCEKWKFMKNEKVRVKKDPILSIL
jgi:hypothetical protein